MSANRRSRTGLFFCHGGPGIRKIKIRLSEDKLYWLYLVIARGLCWWANPFSVRQFQASEPEDIIGQHIKRHFISATTTTGIVTVNFEIQVPKWSKSIVVRSLLVDSHPPPPQAAGTALPNSLHPTPLISGASNVRDRFVYHNPSYSAVSRSPPTYRYSPIVETAHSKSRDSPRVRTPSNYYMRYRHKFSCGSWDFGCWAVRELILDSRSTWRSRNISIFRCFSSIKIRV